MLSISRIPTSDNNSSLNFTAYSNQPAVKTQEATCLTMVSKSKCLMGRYGGLAILTLKIFFVPIDRVYQSYEFIDSSNVYEN